MRWLNRLFQKYLDINWAGRWYVDWGDWGLGVDLSVVLEPRGTPNRRLDFVSLSLHLGPLAVGVLAEHYRG